MLPNILPQCTSIGILRGGTHEKNFSIALIFFPTKVSLKLPNLINLLNWEWFHNFYQILPTFISHFDQILPTLFSNYCCQVWPATFTFLFELLGGVTPTPGSDVLEFIQNWNLFLVDIGIRKSSDLANHLYFQLRAN